MTLFIVILILSLAGMAFAFRYGYGERFSWTELALCLAAVGLVVVPLSVGVANRLSVDSQTGNWKQFINGSIIEAGTSTIQCYRDGSCRHTYRCDPYTVPVTKTRQVYAGTDANGNSQYRTETYIELETRYHSCPYATVEYNYWVTLADIEERRVVMDSHVFDLNPVEWRPGSGLPGVPRGPSPAWVKYRDELNSGIIPSQTNVQEYKNFILPSTKTLLKETSGDIERYRRLGLIVDHTRGLPDPMDGFDAAKFQAVGVKVNEHSWNDALGQFNAAFGMMKQGDMHIIAVDHSKVSNPDNYIRSLVAYWQSPEMGKWGLPKNALVVVFGVTKDGSTIKWTRAKTGMPHGNGEMLRALGDIEGAFSPGHILGTTTGTIKSGEVIYRPAEAEVPNIVFREAPFKRACMAKCDDEGDNGRGFVSLEKDVQPILGFWSYLAIYAVVIPIALGLFFGASSVISIRETNRK